MELDVEGEGEKQGVENKENRIRDGWEEARKRNEVNKGKVES